MVEYKRRFMSYRFFGEFKDSELTLSSDDIFHMSRVLRIKADEKVEIVADNKLFSVYVKSFNPFTIEIIDVKELIKEEMEITLIYALPKGDKLDLVLQKSVELGVDHIILVDSERTITKIHQHKVGAKLDRYQKIIRSAAMQSKRNTLPLVSGPMPLSKALKLDFALKLMAHEKATLPFAKVVKELKQVPSSISILVGPEGGFSDEEVKMATTFNYKVVSYGPLILRSETAPLYALSVINNYKEGLKL